MYTSSFDFTKTGSGQTQGKHFHSIELKQESLLMHRGPLKKALTLRDVIGDRERFPTFEGERHERRDNSGNTVWKDRW
jgi:hypothetical protein